MPVVELGRLARERGVLSVVDGAQAAGGIVVDVKALGVDVYATSGHKWLLGPKGTGLLYLSEQLGRRVDPIALQGGRVSYSPSSGVRNIPGLIGLGSSIEYLAVRGPAAIEAHNLELASAVHAALTGIPKVAVVSGPSAPLASPLVSYRLPSDVPARDLYQRLLDRHRVVVKVVPEEWFNGQRISTHLFNSRSDIDRLAAALRAELG
jgi:selenocysteine lyase/cysteine desulfurase